MYELKIQQARPFYYDPLIIDHPPIRQNAKAAAKDFEIASIEVPRAMPGAESKDFSFEMFLSFGNDVEDGKMFGNENVFLSIEDGSLSVTINGEALPVPDQDGPFHLAVIYSDLSLEVYVNGVKTGFIKAVNGFVEPTVFVFSSLNAVVSDLAIYLERLEESKIEHAAFGIYDRDPSVYVEGDYLTLGLESLQEIARVELPGVNFKPTAGVTVDDIVTTTISTEVMFSVVVPDGVNFAKFNVDADAIIEYSLDDDETWISLTSSLINVSGQTDVEFRCNLTEGSQIRSVSGYFYDTLEVRSTGGAVTVDLSGKALGHYFDPVMRRKPRATTVTDRIFELSESFGGVTAYVYVSNESNTTVIDSFGALLRVVDGEFETNNLEVNGGLGPKFGWNLVSFQASLSGLFTISAQDISYVSFRDNWDDGDYDVIFGYQSLEVNGGSINVEDQGSLVASREWVTVT